MQAFQCGIQYPRLADFVTLRQVGSRFPNQESNPHSPILTTGPLRKVPAGAPLKAPAPPEGFTGQLSGEGTPGLGLESELLLREGTGGEVGAGQGCVEETRGPLVCRA